MQVLHRLVWVWPDASPNNYLEAMAKTPSVAEELLDEDKCLYVHPW